MLLDPLDHAIGTRAKVRLLRALVPLDRPVSGREAARLAGVSRQAIRSLDELVAVGIVRRQETAGQHLYTLPLAPIQNDPESAITTRSVRSVSISHANQSGRDRFSRLRAPDIERDMCSKSLDFCVPCAYYSFRPFTPGADPLWPCKHDCQSPPLNSTR